MCSMWSRQPQLPPYLIIASYLLNSCRNCALQMSLVQPVKQPIHICQPCVASFICGSLVFHRWQNWRLELHWIHAGRENPLDLAFARLQLVRPGKQCQACELAMNWKRRLRQMETLLHKPAEKMGEISCQLIRMKHRVGGLSQAQH